MENQNGRGHHAFPQHYSQFNIPFPSNVQYLSNSGPMHHPGLPFHENSYYPSQPQPFNLTSQSINYPRPHNIMPPNNYYLHNSSHRDVRPVSQAEANRFVIPFEQTGRSSSEVAYNKANQSYIRDAPPKAAKPIELQVSAKPFVPERMCEMNKDERGFNNISENTEPKPLQNIEPKPLQNIEPKSVINFEKPVESNTSNVASSICTDSTRPRELLRDKRNVRKSFPASAINKNFATRPNDTGNKKKFPPNQIWRRTNVPNDYYQTSNDHNQLNETQNNYNNPRANKDQNRSKFSCPSNAGNNDPNYYYTRNASQAKIMQEKQIYPRRTEWKRPNNKEEEFRHLHSHKQQDHGVYSGNGRHDANNFGNGRQNVNNFGNGRQNANNFGNGRQDVNNFGKARQRYSFPNEGVNDFNYDSRKYRNEHENNYSERVENKVSRMHYNRPNSYREYNTMPQTNGKTVTRNENITPFGDKRLESYSVIKQQEEPPNVPKCIYSSEEPPQNLTKDDEKMQRESMTDLLSQGLYECMVCCERIKQQHAIWSCSKCYNCFHLGCTKKWAGTPQGGGESGWRCPACQNLNAKMPNGYFCFCRKLREPEWNRRETPHSCGEVCGKKREKEWCTHKCINLCHPGPCPDCSAYIKRKCCCGKNSKEIRCSKGEQYTCEDICGLSLNCGVHFCEMVCHVGPCAPCSVIVDEECFCGKENRTVVCTEEAALQNGFPCNGACNRMLSCGNHSCQQTCHSGTCKPCEMAVDAITTCPCGKMELCGYYKGKKEGRSSCKDPVPTCKDICEKVLKCGTPGSYHTCQFPCHTGPCPPCQDQTAVKCRCGFMDKKIPCSELLTKADEITCEKQCKKLRQCGRHKCGTKCCIDVDHLCTRICDKPLKCRLHKCIEACHRGNCPRCWETSFEELSCHCGASVTFPPIPCGTEPPVCNLPCRRPQACTHTVLHTCHADCKCPPCTTLISKPCFGSHMMMKSTPCYVTAMSCGEQCAKKLPCNLHICQKVCHEGLCVQGSSCPQKCSERRLSCEHPCGSPCHSGPCPNTPCKEKVRVTCACGNRKSEMVCSENDKEYKSLATSKLASMMHNLTTGGSVDLSQIFSGSNNKPEKFERLECNDDCGLLARNRRLALALQITNPDSREALGDQSGLYTDSVKDEARKDLQFAFMVHNALNDLVLKAKESKQKNRSHSFAPMNREKRKFIHEYSKYFGCQSQSYDEEPKKNVVVTACKALSRLPPMSVVAVIQKELGQRKVPGPVFTRKILAGEESLSQMKRLEKSNSFEKKDLSSSQSKNLPPPIDYFDLS